MSEELYLREPTRVLLLPVPGGVRWRRNFVRRYFQNAVLFLPKVPLAVVGTQLRAVLFCMAAVEFWTVEGVVSLVTPV